MKIKVQRTDKNLPLPEYQHKNEDAGMDLRSTKELIIDVSERVLIPTGIKVALPKRHVGLVWPRSGLAWKHGITVLNSPGVIDPGYRGEIHALLINLGSEPFEINYGDRIAQFVVKKFEPIQWDEVETLDDTERGEGGFGHTGK